MELPKNPEDVKTAQRYIWQARKARQRKIEFTLTFAQYKKLSKVKTCFYTGLKLTQEENEMTKFTLDRINNKEGYTKENTVACSMVANQIKNTLEQNPVGEGLTDYDRFMIMEMVSRKVVKNKDRFKES